MLGAAAVLTVAAACLLVNAPVLGLCTLGVTAAAVLAFLYRRRLAAVRLGALVAGLSLLVPMAALIGPAAALPTFPRLFAFRVLLILVAALGLPLLLLRPGPPDLTRWRAAAPLALWAVWLTVTLLWAPDKEVGLRYLFVIATMLAVVAAAASAGLSRRRLALFGTTMVVAYAVIVVFASIEAATGYRLPTSRLADAGARSYAVTSVFHNQNDLATYLAVCWPFLLGVPFFTRRLRWLALAVALFAPGALAFVRTGSRSSLLAAVIATLVMLAMLARRGAWLRTHRARVLGAFLAVALFAGSAYLLLNDSGSPMLRQFRLSGLQRDIAKGRGSGDVRTTLYGRGLAVAGDRLLVGAGPGQAEGLVTSGLGFTGIGDLHNWWLELYVNGGLPGLALHLIFYLGLAWTLGRRARTHGDALARYLASGTVAALAGFAVGALGPSSVFGFSPMWTLYGLGLAILALPDRVAGTSATIDLEPGAGIPAPSAVGQAQPDADTPPMQKGPAP